MNRPTRGFKNSAFPLSTQFLAQHTQPSFHSDIHKAKRPLQPLSFQIMSGFEIAGVILGALPLVISALEHYKSGKSAASAFVQWRGHLDTLIHRLKQQDTLFFFDLCQLLDIAGIQEFSDDLTREECAKILSSPETEEAMKESSGFSHKIILETLRRYEDCLKKIVLKIRHIQRPGGVSLTSSPPLSPPSAHILICTATYTGGHQASKDDLRALIEANPSVNGRFDFRKRLSFTIERSSLKALLEDLCEDRLSLGLICNGLKAHQESPAREISRGAVNLARRLDQARKRAIPLYAALSSGESTCKCPVQHSVMNQLQSRAAKSDSGNGTAFSLVLRLSGDNLQPAWVTAFLVDLGEEKLEPERHGSTSLVATAQKRSGVRFDHPADYNTNSWRQAPKEKVMRNMCDLAREALENRGPLQLRICVNTLTMRMASLAVGMTPFDKILTVATMEDALAQGSQPASGCRWLTPKSQTLLAVDIASTVLQLQRTGWLRAPWSSQTIQLVVGERAGKEAAAVFISKDLIGTGHVGGIDDFPDLDPRVVILELSILLLELWHCTSIETWATSLGAEAQLESSYPDSRFSAVKRWLDATYRRLTGAYLEAIENCLVIYSGRPQSWDNEKFAQRYCQNIIMPLLQSAKAWPDE